MTTHEVGNPPQQEMKKTSLVQNLVREQDGRVTIEEIANEVVIAHGLIFSILTENIGLSKLSGLVGGLIAHATVATGIFGRFDFQGRGFRRGDVTKFLMANTGFQDIICCTSC
nr:hypothetical transcript [Hymenolepis microstoma]